MIAALSIALASMLVFLSARPASAQTEEHTIAVTPTAGNVIFLSDLVPTITVDTLETSVAAGLENQFSSGVRIDVSLSDHLTAEAGFLFAATELALAPETGGSLAFDTDFFVIGAGGRYRFQASATVSPFLGGGLGVRHLGIASVIEDETDFMWNVGGGALFATGWVADVRVEVRDYMSEFGGEGGTEARLQHDLWAGVGLEFGVF